ncbi:MAG: TonB-dependent receptor, partial [Bacteroidales bacterium]|nr:TonB-dependent receptor [Bacteroidales bacterium]
PLILSENQYYLVSSRKLNNSIENMQEEAWNYGVNLGFYIPVNDQELIINGEWYYTDFKKQLVVDMDTDPHEISFYELDGEKSYSSVFQLEASYPFFRGFNLTAAFRWMDVKTTYNNVLRKKPLVSDYKALITASYQTPLKKWQFDLTSQFNGGGRMPDPDKLNPLWDTTFPAYMVVHAQVTKNFRDWSIYAGLENMFNYTQENSVIGYDDPFGENFDATMIWGPVHGRKFYVGLKYNIQRL